MFSSFPKIFSIGTDYIRDIFNNPVEITEKVDGSQFSFALIDDELLMRSKGKQLFIENPEPLFKEGVEYVLSIRDKIPSNKIFYCEYLKKPKHNTLKYNRIPTNHLTLFSVLDITQKFDRNIQDYAETLNIDCVPILFKGNINSIDELLDLLNIESFLGGPTIEGVVVKNYDNPFLLGGQPIPLMAGKFVSEKFKEKNETRWNKEEKSKSKIDSFFESFRTEARWEKAIQHLRDDGKLKNEPKDIGLLIKEIQKDIFEEEEESIKNFLWNEFKGHIARKSTSGFPEWYKERLVNNSFDDYT